MHCIRNKLNSVPLNYASDLSFSMHLQFSVTYHVTYCKYHLGCRQASENKRIDLFDGPSVEDGFGEENVLLASSKWQHHVPYKFAHVNM